MGLFEQWPYVNFHDLNLDWIIKKIKNVETAEANSQASAEASAESAAASQLSAENSQTSAEASQLSAEESAAEAASIAGKATQIDVNTARIDNIIADGQQTEGNTELIDIRVGENGNTFTTAGSSVRSITGALANLIKTSSGGIIPSYEPGSINATTGENAVVNNRIRTSGNVPNFCVIKELDPNYAARAFFYDENDTFIAAGNNITVFPHMFSNSNASYVRFVFSPIDPSYTLNLDELTRTCVITNEYDFIYMGNAVKKGFTDFSIDNDDLCVNGYYNFSTTDLSSITNKPEDITRGGIIINLKQFSATKNFRIIIDASFNVWMKYSGQTTWTKILPLPEEVVTDTVWFALGDSITQGFTSSGGEIGPITPNNYVHYVGEYNKYTYTNYGVGGSGYIHNGTVLDRLNAKDKSDTIDFSECDLVTLAFGVNDWHYNMPIGTVNDQPDAGDTMASNMKYVIEKIMTDNPLCRIVVILPMNCSKYGGDFNSNWALGHALSTAGTLQHVIDVEKQICEYYGIKYIDLSKYGMVNRLNINDVLSDGIHPIESLYKQIAKALAYEIEFK